MAPKVSKAGLYESEYLVKIKKEGRAAHGETKKLHGRIDPVATLVEGQVALVPVDRQEPEQEDQTVHLQALRRDAGGVVLCEHLPEKHDKCERRRHGT